VEKRTGFGKGEAMCRTPTTSFRAESKAPSTVMPGTVTNSMASLGAKGAMRGWGCNSSIEKGCRTEMRAR
jgi:hypothetical protein